MADIEKEGTPLEWESKRYYVYSRTEGSPREVNLPLVESTDNDVKRFKLQETELLWSKSGFIVARNFEFTIGLDRVGPSNIFRLTYDLLVPDELDSNRGHAMPGPFGIWNVFLISSDGKNTLPNGFMERFGFLEWGCPGGSGFKRIPIPRESDGRLVRDHIRWKTTDVFTNFDACFSVTLRPEHNWLWTRRC
ncbi:hypothetical protein [uncultured Litoreibacter sp.]|uniref:hypothetical protein n=1 Tax=uncultured Litoreibacter sp. TaxID=1392394 RepID=UPI0026186200|nr:hypothetical protein [uncultured Litoreibacter sp.]